MFLLIEKLVFYVKISRFGGLYFILRRLETIFTHFTEEQLPWPPIAY